MAATCARGTRGLVQENRGLFTNRARLEEAQGTDQGDAGAIDLGSGVQLSAGGISTYLPLAGMVDLDAERKRIEKELANVEGQINRTEGLLGNENFVGRAPEQVVQRERDKLKELEAQRAQVSASLSQLGL